jgi:C1A family cysteine protease
MFNFRKAKFRALAFMLAALVVLLLGAAAAYAADSEHAQIMQAIRDRGARWLAGETSISKLSHEARKKRVGAIKPIVTDDEHLAAVQEQSALATVTVPTGFDWRTNGGDWVSNIRDQGNCGSCWAFACTAALESQVLLSKNASGGDINLAEQILVACSPAGNCNGGSINTAADYIRDFGLPAETCFPYTAANNTCANACPNWTDNDYHIAGWHWVATTNPTVDALKNALCAYGPLVTTMDVYSDFFSYGSGVYTHVSGTYQGGHAILLIGYDDTGQYFTAKNSWGPYWGEAGYFRIGYSELKNSVYFGDYTIAYEGSTPPAPPAPPAACSYSLSPTSKTFQAAGGTGTITVSSQSNCGWSALSNATWITVTSGKTGISSGSVKYSVATNGTYTQRTGTVTIAGKTFTVKQSGKIRRNFYF